jgi:hypothetical protein
VGKRTPLRPAYTANLGTLIAADIPIRAMCDRCDGYRDVALRELAAVKGADYDLWGRRTRCRITAGCAGWNHFYFYGRGRYETMSGRRG